MIAAASLLGLAAVLAFGTCVYGRLKRGDTRDVIGTGVAVLLGVVGSIVLLVAAIVVALVGVIA